MWHRKKVTPETFLNLLCTYLKNEVARVGRARGTGAGWEIWLQVELCMFVEWEVNGDITREKSYGGNSKSRGDFLLNDNQAKGRTVVEIKTNLLGEGAYDFARRVATDYDKQLRAATGTHTMVEGIWVGKDPTKAIGGGEVMGVIPVVPGSVYLLHAGAA